MSATAEVSPQTCMVLAGIPSRARDQAKPRCLSPISCVVSWVVLDGIWVGCRCVVLCKVGVLWSA